jgi:hypothetical protein
LTEYEVLRWSKRAAEGGNRVKGRDQEEWREEHSIPESSARIRDGGGKVVSAFLSLSVPPFLAFFTIISWKVVNQMVMM